MDRRTELGVELGRDEPRNARFLTRASDEDDFGSYARRVQDVRGKTDGRLYPQLERNDEASEEDVEYYLSEWSL